MHAKQERTCKPWPALCPKARALLAKSRQQKRRISFMPWTDAPEFCASLDDGGTCYLALKLITSTAPLSHPIRLIHLRASAADTWTIPADKMNSPKLFCMPLSDATLDVVEQARPFNGDGYLFPSMKTGLVSDAMMLRHMEKRDLQACPHGFDLLPKALTSIVNVCWSVCHIWCHRFGQARRAWRPHIAQVSDALLWVSGYRAMSTA